MTATTLHAVAAYLPPTSFSLEKVGEVLGLTANEVRRYRRFFGLDQVRWDPGAGQGDLLVSAARALPGLAEQTPRIRYVIHARTLEPTAPYSANPLRQACQELGLTGATAFGLSQHACASGLLAVDLAGRMLAADGDPDALALVLTGEKTYPHVARYMPPATVMGEASAACLVGIDGPHDELIGYTTITDGRFHAVTARSGELATQFEQAYPHALADLILTALRQAGLSLSDLTMILPHNVNRISWTRLCKLLGLPFDRVMLDNMPVTGHSFCADPFINYAHARDRGQLAAGDHYLMASVGLGATFSAMVFRH